MTYIFRVTLPGIKGFARVYEVNGKNSLYHFHKQMMYDMEFAPDQIVLFKALDAAGRVMARYATVDIGDGAIDSISIRKAVEAGAVSFVYFYDTTNKRSVIVTLEKTLEKGTADRPVLLESKGPNPEAFLNGYVAFEDLPVQQQRHLLSRDPDQDDDDEDEDNDDEDDETEEIFDENEGEDE